MTRCPKCKSNLSIPKSARGKEIVRCTRCRSEYSLAELRGKGSHEVLATASAAEASADEELFASADDAALAARR
jgi:hypothetical protein